MTKNEVATMQGLLSSLSLDKAVAFDNEDYENMNIIETKIATLLSFARRIGYRYEKTTEVNTYYCVNYEHYKLIKE